MPPPAAWRQIVDPRQLGVILVALLAASPVAVAGWASKGSYEPDTRADVTGGLMQFFPDTTPDSSRLVVYFNGFSSLGGPLGSSVNPNSAALHSSIGLAPFLPLALFGIWKDCNGDGYVGLGDNGLLEYPPSLLLNASICPVIQPSPETPWNSHNDGSWVIEFIPIGYDDVRTPENENSMNVNDTRSRVWADWGRPGDPPSLVCALQPMPYGTFRSTGGFLRYADCFTAFRVTGAVNAAAAATGLGAISFADAPPDRPDRSNSMLNQMNPWGSEADPAAATLFDCTSSEHVVVQDPTDPNGHGNGQLRTLASVPVGDRTYYVNGTDEEGRIMDHTLHPLAPRTGSGSPAGTVNETQAGLTDCDRSDTDETIDLDGRRAGSDGDLPYALEGPNEPVSPFGPRRRSDHVLAFEEGIRDNGTVSSLFGQRTRSDLGLGTTSLTGFWVGHGSNALGRNPYVSRSDIALEPVTYITYYASVAPHLVTNLHLRFPSGAPAVYGVEGCSAGTVDCDPANWWKDASGNSTMPRDARLGVDPQNPTVPAETPETEIGVRALQLYYSRDVDCFDTSFEAARAGGVHWGRLTQTLCDLA